MADANPSDPVPVRVATSDLPRRTASAAVMIGVAALAFWAGGVWLDIFIVLVAAATYYEFARLVARIAWPSSGKLAACLGGAAYIGLAAFLLTRISSRETLILIVGSVILVDTLAYAFGRTLGGPKIAPKISPSKTWAGLLGGVVGATLALVLWTAFASVNAAVVHRPPLAWAALILPGAAIAIAAQSGDFFESWLKRRAGVKDSSNLIPGHGGVFDRTDGLLPVAILFGLALQATAPHWIAG